jgi:protein-S-isoprenylcysteine O-methyltransferase Ste14
VSEKEDQMATTGKMAIATIAGVGVQLGLAILGRGGFDGFFGEPALIALAVLTIIIAAVALLTGANLNPGEREDRSNRWVIAAFALIGLAIAYLPALCDRLDFWTFGGSSARWLGVALFVLGCTLRLWPVFVLGHRFSGLVAIQQNHKLVTSGPYSCIRHPSYLGLLISEAGWSLAFRSTIGLLLTALTLPVLIARVNAEEALLQTYFGAEYEAYRQRTRRFLPGIY